MNKATVISNIKEIAGKTLPANSTLILYGSRARGDNRPDSDWDLLILIKWCWYFHRRKLYHNDRTANQRKKQ